MLEATPLPLSPSALRPWQLWALALVPSVPNFRAIAADPQARASRAYLWLGLAALVGVFVSTVIGLVVTAAWGVSADPTFIFNSLPAAPFTLSSAAYSLVCGVPISAGGVLLGVSVLVGASHLLARFMGGRAAFGPYLYACAAIYVPIGLLDSLFSGLPRLNLVVLATSLYALLLSVVAVRAVHQVGWVKAALAALLVPLLTALLVAALAVSALALLAYFFKDG